MKDDIDLVILDLIIPYKSGMEVLPVCKGCKA
jgi:DNA-binding response OmpR family regulator